jgi:hypothetical protein
MRETRTGQQVAQLRDRYMITMIKIATSVPKHVAGHYTISLHSKNKSAFGDVANTLYTGTTSFCLLVFVSYGLVKSINNTG